ncbi:hypothetical protein [Azospirillum thermophilum]|uniref:Uncharacterized protein n=1 Tax=Azospirillum thermophilum TaxID=2202148 RepID=A0A2S2CSX5_9PROT|nr:hypothetical protein [Azospirillum thermophilum]AWK87586.1 hypothetical protein DEW08_16375 [Azospirillum thermophilum]
MPVPPPAPPPAPPGTGGATDPAASPDPAAVAERALERRSRSTAGTVLTSWRGILDLNALSPRRKSLLGE